MLGVRSASHNVLRLVIAIIGVIAVIVGLGMGWMHFTMMGGMGRP